MSLQFQPPSGPTRQDRKDADLQQVVGQIGTIASQWASYKLQRKQQQLQEMQIQAQMNALKRAGTAKYGTGAPPPLQAGRLLSAPPAGAGPEEQMFGFEASMPTEAPESRQAQISRVGTNTYGAETDRIKAEQERPSRKQMKITDKNFIFDYDPVSGGLTEQSTGAAYDKTRHGNFMVPGVNRVLPAGEVDSLATLETLNTKANEIRGLAKTADFIGPLAGRWEKLKSNFVDTPEYTEMSTKVGQLIETAYALSGKAITESERQSLIESFWGQITDPKGNFDVKMDSFLNFVQQKAGAKQKLFKEAGYRTPTTDMGGGQSAPTQPQSSGAGLQTKTGKKVTVSGFTVTK